MTATFYRAVYGIPVLALIWFASRDRDDRNRRERLLAFGSGLALAVDLNLWHESIALVGAGLGTVIPNVQIVFVALATWIRRGERPRLRTVAMIGVVLLGVALTSGLARSDAYGTRPVAGVALGVAAGFCYAIFLIVFRASNRGLVPPAGPLLDATLGMAAGALLVRGLRLGVRDRGEPGGASMAAGARPRLAGGGVALHRDRVAAAAGACHLRDAAHPAGLRHLLGRALLRRAPVGAPMDWVGDRAGGRGQSFVRSRHRGDGRQARGAA